LTKLHRPDLFQQLILTKEMKSLIKELEEHTIGDWEKEAIEKGRKFTKR